mgnify:FL=1
MCDTIALITFDRFVRYWIMNNVLRFGLVITLLIVPFAGEVMATGVGGAPPCWPPPCIPIAGGLSLLVAAGTLLGGKKALDLRRSRKGSV